MASWAKRRPSSIPRRSAAIVLAMTIFVGCGSPPEASETPGVSAAPLGVLVSCGGAPFAPSALTDGPDPLAMSAEPYGVLGAFLRDPGPDIAWLPDGGWHLLASSDRQVTVGRLVDQAAGEPPVVTIDVTSDGTIWRVTDWQRCRPAAFLPDGVPGMWWLAEPAGPDDYLLKTLLSELTCAGRATFEGRIAPPVIDYGRLTVTIAIGIRPHPGFQECGPRPEPTPFDIALTEPLGDRTLLDGGHWPPLDPTRPRD